MTAYWLKIIGLAPFSVPIKVSGRTSFHHSNIEPCRYSRRGLAYNVLFLIPMLIASVIWFNLSNIFSGNNLAKYSVFDLGIVIRTAESSVLMVVACIVVISWGCNQEEGASIVKRLFEVDARLSVLKRDPFNERGLVLIAVHAIVNASFWVVFWSRRTVYLSPGALLVEFFTKLPHYITQWFVFEYFVVVGLLAQYFQILNEYLLGLNELCDYSSRQRVGDGFLVPVISAQGIRGGQLSRLRLLQGVRTMLYELCGDVAEFFSFPILFCIGCCFIPLVREITGVIAFSYDSYVVLAANASYIILIIVACVYPIMSLATYVARTGKQARLTGLIVHKLLSARPIIGEMKSELTQFSLQLLHEEIKFTAFGFFALDARMLIPVLGATLSYFVGLMPVQSIKMSIGSNSTTPQL